MLRTRSPLLPLLCLSLLPYTLTLHAEERAPTSAPSGEQTELPTAVERPPLGERSQAEAQALTRQLPASEQQQLQAGDETFLALWQPANVGEPSGAVILLPGDSESADWPQTVGPLRSKLPDAGWHSLSLSLPDPEGDPLLTRAAPSSPTPDSTETPADASAAADPTSDDSASEPAASAAPAAPDPASLRQAHAERVLARIAAGIAFAQQQQAQTVVLLGHGSGAYWAARYLAERQPANVQNLLLVAAELPEGFSPALEELIPNLKLATGDFYYKDQANDRTAALKRLQAGKRQQHPAYIQVAMKALPGNRAAEQEQLYRRIRGWLSLHLQASAPPAATATPAGAPGG